MEILKEKIALLEGNHHSSKQGTDENVHEDQISKNSEDETNSKEETEPSGRNEGTQVSEWQRSKISEDMREMEEQFKREMEGDQINARLEGIHRDSVDEHNEENNVQYEPSIESSHDEQDLTKSSVDESKASEGENLGSSTLAGRSLKSRYTSRKRYTPYIEYTKLSFKVSPFPFSAS